MNFRHLLTRLSRLNLTAAAREEAALKAEFRREDARMVAEGRCAEIWADRRRNLGISEFGRTELVTINGVRIRKPSGTASQIDAKQDGPSRAGTAAAKPQADGDHPVFSA